MSRLAVKAFGGGLGCATLLTAPVTIAPASFLLVERGFSTLGTLGWLIATFGPITMSGLMLIKAHRAKLAWHLHLALIPIVVIVYRLGTSLFFYGLKASGDSLVEGFALFAAIGYLALTLFTQVIAILTILLGRITRRASVY